MSTGAGLQNSYGPEVTPYQWQRSNQQPPEVQSQAQRGELSLEPVVKGEGPATESTTATTETVRKKILGLPVLIFWLLVVLAILIVLGLGIGVGVGLSQGSKNSPSPQDQTSTSTAIESTESHHSTATKTSSASPTYVTAGATGISSNSCNSTTPKSYVADDGTSFTEYCFTDWPGGDEAANGNGKVTDLDKTIVYTFEACMNYCLTYNSGLDDGDTKCEAVTYNANLTSSVAGQGGNCFLKDRKGVDVQAVAEAASAAVAH